MKLIYGTKNQAKLDSMNRIVEDLPIEVTDLSGFKGSLPDVDESGNSPLENAKIKALAYYKAIKEPIFSCDSGLYIEGLSEEKQPGVFIRRVNGQTLNDDEMIEYYANLAKENGGKLTVYYKNAIHLILDDDTQIGYDGEEIASERFYIVDRPHQKRTKGFPLNALSVDMKTGKYYDDLKRNEQVKTKTSLGFYQFFKRLVEKH